MKTFRNSIDVLFHGRLQEIALCTNVSTDTIVQ